MRPFLKGIFLVGAFSLGVLLPAAPAIAATTTIGQLAPDPSVAEYHEGYEYGGYQYPPGYTYTYSPPAALCTTAQDMLQSSVGSGGGYVVPANAEAITAWRTNATTGAGQEVTFKVFRKIGEPATYEVVGQDGPRTLTPAASANVRGKINSFSGLSIPVQAGDVIGLYPSNAAAAHQACMFATAGELKTSATNLSPSGSGPFTGAPGDRLNLSADVQLKSTGGPVQHTLSVSVAGGGAGTVQSSPTGIEACASVCSQAFDDGKSVTLSASPDSYSTFSGWSGGGCSGQATCQVTVSADSTVTATFDVKGGGGNGSGYEYPSGYGSPAGESGGQAQGKTAPKCKKPGANKAKCGKKARVVARRAHNTTLGKEILTTKKGRTLYSLSAEGGKTFICTGGCLSTWRPLTVPKGIRPLGPVRLGTVVRPEGSLQVTYHGRPLYTFSGDSAPSDANGQGFKDVGTWEAAVVPPPKR